MPSTATASMASTNNQQDTQKHTYTLRHAHLGRQRAFIWKQRKHRDGTHNKRSSQQYAWVNACEGGNNICVCAKANVSSQFLCSMSYMDSCFRSLWLSVCCQSLSKSRIWEKRLETLWTAWMWEWIRMREGVRNRSGGRETEEHYEVKKWISILPPVHNLFLRTDCFFGSGVALPGQARIIRAEMQKL